MAEENQITMKEPQQVTTKNSKKVGASKRLAEYNCKKREVQKSEAQKSEVQKSEVSQYYGIGAIVAVVVIGALSYYLYQAKKGVTTTNVVPTQQPRPQTDKFEME